MKDYQPILSFGEEDAELYDTAPDVEQRRDTTPTLAFLERLASGGPALELAIGTGRIALPLAARGIRVTASTSRLRWSPGCARSRVAITLP
jgi:hypothetical protein